MGSPETDDTVALHVELAQAHATIKSLSELVQHSNYMLSTMAPLVDLVATWKSVAAQEDTPPEKVVADFAVAAALATGLFDKWKEAQTKKYEPSVDTDASR